MTVTEKVAYVRGLFDGMGLDKDESSQAKILAEVLGVLKEVGEELENLDAALDAVAGGLSDVEEAVYGGDDEDGCCCHHHHGHGENGEDDDFFEAVCPNCGEELLIDQSVLEAGSIDCPNCGQKFALSFEDDDGENPE